MHEKGGVYQMNFSKSILCMRIGVVAFLKERPESSLYVRLRVRSNLTAQLGGTL